MGSSVLQTVGISKAFPGVQALKDINFDLQRGEVHAIVGENGAGKSTLMKILGGLYQQDEGGIMIDGVQVQIMCPRDSLRHGISIVYQEMNLVPVLSAAENIFLGDERRSAKTRLINRREMMVEAQKYLDMLSVGHIDASARVSTLSISQQQIVEIARAVKQRSKVLILDEPTSVVGQEETDLLFKVIRRLRDEGISIIYISHRLDEIFQVCDRVTVLRDGLHVGTCPLANGAVQKIDLIRMMVGREIGHIYRESCDLHDETEVVLEVEHLSRDREFQDISFKLRKGEILGFSGLVGAGRTEIMKAVMGITRPREGVVRIFGQEIRRPHVKKSMALGLAFVPEDRKKEGLVLCEPMKNNMALSTLRSFARFGFIRRDQLDRVAEEYVRSLNIRPGYIDRKARFFSGGNQQKIVLAKCLRINPRIFILDEPTRGIDVGAKQEFYGIIGEMARNGISIILISSEMEEIIGLSDRIIVIHEGRITAEIDSADANQEIILRKASGMD